MSQETKAHLVLQALLNQGAIEAIFLDSLKSTGLTVDRSIIPTSLDLSNDEQLLKDPNAHAVKVREFVPHS